MHNQFNKMKKVALIVMVCLAYSTTYSQKIPKTSTQYINKLMDSLKYFSIEMSKPEYEFIFRFKADSAFTKNFVRALKQPFSFYYPFDSVKSVSCLYPKDSSFRIFTWEVMRDFDMYRQKGVIQMNTSDGSMKIFPLFDVSDFTKRPADSVRTPKNWIGALYYKMIEKQWNGKKFYTLLGVDGNDARSKKKWIDVLYFDLDDQPFFGGDFFNYIPDDIKPKPPVKRFCLEYQKEAKVRITYDEQQDQIAFDHLFSEEGTPQRKYTLVSSGEFETFTWMNGVWVHRYKSESELPAQKVTVPVPILDKNGNIDEKKLDELSQKADSKTETKTEKKATETKK